LTDAAIREKLAVLLENAPESYEFGDPCRESDLVIVPVALRWFYRRSNGAMLCDGDLLFFPARGGPEEEGTIELASRLARDANWHVPTGVVLFGKEAGDEVIGVWTGPRDEERFPSPVTITGLIFKPAAHALLASSFERYLMTRLLWDRLDDEDADEILDLFEVPAALRVDDVEELDAAAWFAWADPALGGPPVDPYREGMTGQQIAQIVRGGAANPK
jgi:hypothetical protein